MTRDILKLGVGLGLRICGPVFRAETSAKGIDLVQMSSAPEHGPKAINQWRCCWSRLSSSVAETGRSLIKVGNSKQGVAWTRHCRARWSMISTLYHIVLQYELTIAGCAMKTVSTCRKAPYSDTPERMNNNLQNWLGMVICHYNVYCNTRDKHTMVIANVNCKFQVRQLKTKAEHQLIHER